MNPLVWIFAVLVILLVFGGEYARKRDAKKAFKRGVLAGQQGPGYRHSDSQLPADRVYYVAALPRCPITTTLTPVLIDNKEDIWLMQAGHGNGKPFELNKYYVIKEFGHGRRMLVVLEPKMAARA